MAKQHPDDRKKTKTKPAEDAKLTANAEAAKSDDGTETKKTQLSQKSPLPTQLAKKSPLATQLAKKSPQPTMLSPGDAGPATPVQPPKADSDDDEVVTAESADSGVVEVAAAAADDEDVFTAEALAEDQVAANKSAPETPVKAEQAEDVMAEDILEGDVVEPTGAESSVFVQGKKSRTTDVTDAFDSEAPPGDDLDKTQSFEAEGDEDSSAVDLGARLHPKKGYSHAGVDEVAEALESGVQLEGVSDESLSSRRPEPSVEFDDLATAEEPGAEDSSSIVQRRGDNLSDADLAIAEDAARSAKAAEVDADNLWDNVEPAEPDAEVETETRLPGKKKARAEAEEESAEEDDDETPASRRSGGGTAVMDKPAPPKYGRRWLGGILVGALLVVGGLGATWFFAPEVLSDLVGSPAAAKKPAPQPPAPQLTVAQRAHDEIDQGNYESALELLKDADKTPGNLSTRAQAAWLKYQKDQTEKKADLNKNDADVKAVLADLDEAKNELLKDQILKSLEFKALKDAASGNKGNDKTLVEVRDLLAKANIKADIKDLPMAIGQALTAKEQAESLVQEIRKTLVETKQLADADMLDPAAFAKIAKGVADKQAALAAVDKLLKDAMIPDAGAKGVEGLVTAKKDLDDKLAEVNKFLKNEKVKGEGSKGLQELAAVRNQLAKDRDELDQAIKAAYQELSDADIAPKGGDPRKQLLAGAKAARSRAESPLTIPLTQLAATLGGLGVNPAQGVKSAFDASALLAELKYYQLREPLIQSPEQKLDSYLSIYQDRSRTNAAEQAAALKDAAWVQSPEAKASPAARAKAQAVKGLILRNQDKHAEAKQALADAVATPDAGAWVAQVKQALKELSDPASFYLPRIDQLQSSGQLKTAQQELAGALKAMPNDGRLLAQRALLRLEELRGAGKIPADVQAAIRQDAELALKDAKTAADGAFALGLLEEELGNYSQAEKLLRQAVKSHKGSPEEASRYRIALARILQRDRTPTVAPVFAPPQPKEEKKAVEATGALNQVFPLAAMLVLAQAGGGADGIDPAGDAALKESADIAKDLIESPNPKIKGQGYLLLGQALAKQGKRTEGLKEYLKGMELLYPGMASKELGKLIDEHPAFQQPDATKAPSAYLAEVHFGKGLHLYWSRDYSAAEGHFKQAVGFFGQDARYQYYLGLAQYAQKSKAKREAALYSFEQGAKLEAANHPPVTEINASLERIQGGLRQTINAYRSKAIELRN